MASLDELECHFSWITDEVLEDHDIEKVVQSLQWDADYDDGKVMKQSFVAFLKTRGTNPNLHDALAEAEASVGICQDPAIDEDPCRLRGYELIALANKAHIQEMMGDETGKEETLNIIPKLKAEDFSVTENAKTRSTLDEDATTAGKKDDSRKKKIFQACNAGVRAYALYDLSLNEESLVLFRAAEELDPDCYHWPLGRGVTAGRLQRRMKQICKDPYHGYPRLHKQLEDEQERSLLRAVELTKNKGHIALTRLADVYFYRGRGNPQFPKTQNKDLLKKAEKLLLQAYELNPNYVVLLKRLGKALVEIDREKHEKFAEECLLKAHTMDPINSMTLHRLGQFYEHASDSVKDLPQAEEYYLKAVTSGTRRNLMPEIDLSRVRIKQNRNYDFQKHFKDMLKHYTSEEDQIVIKKKVEKLQQNQLKHKMRNSRF